MLLQKAIHKKAYNQMKSVIISVLRTELPSSETNPHFLQLSQAIIVSKDSKVFSK